MYFLLAGRNMALYNLTYKRVARLSKQFTVENIVHFQQL